MENYRLLFQPEEDVTLRPSRSYSIEFDDPNAGRQTCRLFFTGETALFYQWKNEPDYPLLYRRIDDALSTDACKAQFCVKLDGREYPKKLYDKLLWKPKLSYLMLHSYSDQWQGGIFAKGERIGVREGGYLRMRFEVRYLRDGMSRHDVTVPPDEAYGFDFPSGTYDWREIRLPLTIPDEKTASVCVWIEGLLYDGTLSLERPYLKSGNGYNILPDFSTNAPGRPRFNWIGQNLSRKEWPEFEISLNGKLFYKGGIFERSHRYSEAELPIPDGLLRQEGNRLTFRLISDYRDALPYHLHEVGIVSEPDDSFRVISCPEQVTVSRAFPVLIQSHTTNPLEITSEDGGVRGVRLPDRLREGLNVILLQCDEPANDVEFTLRDGMTEQTCTIRQALLRREDNVLTGTGDMIYIHQRTEDTIHYLCWYLANHVGNLITIRPTYRWSGTRMLNPRMWEEFVRLVNAMGMKYAHMLDGRELPGGCANPNATMLAGPGFLGRQKHEQDGAYAYWGVMDLSDDYDEERFYDMRILDVLHDPETASLQNTPEDYHASGDKVVLYRDLSVAPDKVYFVNAKGYPAEPALRPVYEKIIRSASDTCNEQENSFIECGDDVQFTIYEQPDGSRHIYLLATDWYNPSAEPRRATLRLDGKRYPVAVPFGNPVKMIIRQDAAVWTDSRDCDVLSIDGNTAKLQGYGTGEFTAALKGILKEYNSKNKNAVVFGRTSTVEMEIV